jgi:hypothetical protein
MVPAPEAEVEREFSPETRELLDCIELEKTRLRDLGARYRAATTEAGALAIQHEIASVKRATELELLDIQLRHARQAGLADQAEVIEQAIQALEAGDHTGEPRPRAAVVGN